MKKILAPLLMLLILAGCADKKRPESFLPALELKVPKSLNKYEQVTLFFDETVKNLNLQTYLLEEKAELCQPILEKPADALTETERAQLGACMMNFLDEYGRYLMGISEIELAGSSLSESVDITDRDKVEELLKQVLRYTNQVKDKYEHFGLTKEDIEAAE